MNQLYLKMKNTLVGMNDGLDTTEERIDWLINRRKD